MLTPLCLCLITRSPNSRLRTLRGNQNTLLSQTKTSHPPTNLTRSPNPLHNSGKNFRSNQTARFFSDYDHTRSPFFFALAAPMACASFAKLNAASSPWIGGQQSFSRRNRLSTPRVSVPIRAKAYTDELVQTAVSLIFSLIPPNP